MNPKIKYNNIVTTLLERMSVMLDDLAAFAFGLLATSKEKAEELVGYLVDKGEMKREEARKLVNRLIEKGSLEGERFLNRTKGAISERIITRDDFERLEAKIDQLLSKLENSQSPR